MEAGSAAGNGGAGKEGSGSRFRRVCVFCRSSSGKRSSYRDAAVELGKELVSEHRAPARTPYPWPLHLHGMVVFCLVRRPDPTWASVPDCLNVALAQVARKVDLVYGGGSLGLMGEVSEAVHKGGGHVIGSVASLVRPFTASSNFCVSRSSI